MTFSVKQRLLVQMSRRGIVLWKTLVTGHSTGGDLGLVVIF